MHKPPNPADFAELSIAACLACCQACRTYAENLGDSAAEHGAADTIHRARACAEVCMSCAGLIGGRAATAAGVAGICALVCDQYAAWARHREAPEHVEQSLQETCIAACHLAAIWCRAFNAEVGR